MIITVEEYEEIVVGAGHPTASPDWEESRREGLMDYCFLGRDSMSATEILHF